MPEGTVEGTLKLIYEELKTIRESTTDTKTALARVEATIKPLFDNGQRGLITRLQDDLAEKADLTDLDELHDTVEGLMKWKWMVLGGSAVLGFIVSLVTEAAVHFFFH